MIPTTTDDLTDEQIFDISEQFGSFEFGDAQGAKTLEFARAIIAASRIVQGDEVEARTEYLQSTLNTLRVALVKPMAELFGVHPDDLSANLPETNHGNQ